MMIGPREKEKRDRVDDDKSEGKTVRWAAEGKKNKSKND